MKSGESERETVPFWQVSESPYLRLLNGIAENVYQIHTQQLICPFCVGIGITIFEQM